VIRSEIAVPLDADGLDAARIALDQRRRRERRERRRRRQRRQRLLWTVGYVGLVNIAAWAALETPDQLLTAEALLRWDKFEHFIVFLAATLAAAVFLTRWASIGIQALVLLNAGLVIEILQAYDVKRTADVADFAFDQLGILVGWLSFRLYRRLTGYQHEQRSARARRRRAS